MTEYDNSRSTKNCILCRGTETEWGLYPHWYGTFERPICKRCHDTEIRIWPSEYEVQIWVRDRSKRKNICCIGSFEILRDERHDLTQEARKNIEIGIRRALDKFEDELIKVLRTLRGKGEEVQ
jgi:hypothetical protein